MAKTFNAPYYLDVIGTSYCRSRQFKVDEATLEFFKMYNQSADNVIKEHEQMYSYVEGKMKTLRLGLKSYRTFDQAKALADKVGVVLNETMMNESSSMALSIYSPDNLASLLEDKEIKKLSYAVADIFISLVDNFQETFGLTPLEGMAAGLPVVVSDWDGYKDTVRNEIDGFTVNTTTMKPGSGFEYALRHNFGIDTYDHYIGRTSQTVSVDIKDCIEKIILSLL